MSSKKIDIVRESYSKVGPTSDNSSRIAMLKAVQVRTNASGTRSQLFGHFKESQVRGINGDAGQKTYFRAAFSNFTLQ